MSRLAIVSYTAGSESTTLLRNAINEVFQTNPARILRQSGSTFRGRTNDFIINWGSSRSIPDTVVGNATLINNPTNVNQAANKINALNAMSVVGVRTVDYTTDRSVAQQWVEDGAHVFCRHELRGHSGTGIAVTALEEPADLGNVVHSQVLPTAPLYTKGISGLHREFRIHVFKGQVIFLQQKRRASGYRENSDYSNVVRNHGNGWIYAHNNMARPNNACIRNALAAVEALGLDFGAVDVLTHQDEAWVLEVNTAPGLTGETTRTRYRDAVKQLMEGEEITGIQFTQEIPAGPVGPQGPDGVQGVVGDQDDAGTPRPVEAVEEVMEETPEPVAPTVYRNGFAVVEMPRNVEQFETLMDNSVLRVVLSDATPYPNDRFNPRNQIGQVTSVRPSGILPITVQWEQEMNGYTVNDLVVIDTSRPQPENAQPAPAPQQPQTTTARPTQGGTDTVQPDESVQTDGFVNETYYKAIVDGTHVIVQYQSAINAFYMCGFDIPMEVGDVEVVSQIEL